MIKKKIHLIIFGITLIGLFFKSGGIVLATDPHLFLSPVSGSFSANFETKIKIDTGGKAVGGADVYLEYPKSLLKADNVSKGTAFTEVFSHINNDEGKIRINAYFPYTDAGKTLNTTDGLIATITFIPQSAGTTTLNFVCTAGSTTDSNIVERTTIQDVIVCSANLGASYTVSSSGGGSSTSTPTPTPTTSAATSTTTTTTPAAGSVTQTLVLISIGIISLLTGLVLAF